MHAKKSRRATDGFRLSLPQSFFLCWATVGWGQNLSVKGSVSDTKGEPIIGASVVVKGNTTQGTITDLDGQFTLNVPSNSTLVISYIGYVTQEVPAKGTVKVTLKEDNEMLDEVVVIGYGTQRKGDVTSAISSVKSDNFVKGAVKDVGQTDSRKSSRTGHHQSKR